MKNMTFQLFGILILLIATGCRNPEIVQISPDTYLLTKEDHAGIFGSRSKLKADVITQANKFATMQGKIAIGISEREHPVGIMGDWASFEYRFKVVSKYHSTPADLPVLNSKIPVKLAILTFDAKGVDQTVADICLESLSNELASRGYITLIERRKIQTVIAEQKFQSSGLTDDSTGVQIGKLLNADNALLCSVGKLGSTMVLTARLLSIETGTVTQSREVVCEECQNQDILSAVKMLAFTIAN